MARQINIELVLRVDRDGNIQVTQALRDRLDFIGKPPDMAVVQ